MVVGPTYPVIPFPAGRGNRHERGGLSEPDRNTLESLGEAVQCQNSAAPLIDVRS